MNNKKHYLILLKCTLMALIIFSFLFSNDNLESVLLTPNSSTPGDVLFNDKFSIQYGFPGFNSEIGQLNLFFDNNSEYLYHFGIGFIYPNFGISKNLVNDIYMNIDYGVRWGSIGLSKVIQKKENKAMEISSNLFYDSGMDGFFGLIPNGKGIVGRISYIFPLESYIKFLGDNFQISGSIGISVAKYRQGFDESAEDTNDKWCFVDSDNKRYDKYRWKTIDIIPFKLTLSYDL